MDVVKKKKQTENGDEPSEKRSTIQISEQSHKAMMGVRLAKPKPSLYAVLSRLAMWYARQEEYVQTAIIGGVDRGMEFVYADALERLAKELRARAIGRGEIPDNSIAFRTEVLREPESGEVSHPNRSSEARG